MIAQTIETVEPQLRDKRHQLSTTASTYEPLFVLGDFARLMQCVGNVLTNAIKYTEPGGKISISTRSGEANVYIEIADNGTGIAPTCCHECSICSCRASAHWIERRVA